MANQIILKRSATPGKVPTTSQLALGEIGINTYDGLIYIKKDDGTPSVVQIGGVTSVNGETGAVSLDTSDISENGALYFTQARARASVSASGNLSYNAGTGVFSYSTPTTIASLSNHTTDNLTEGTTNKYYADSLARGAISVSAGAGGYNASTGVISIPNNTSQLTNGANFATTSYVNSAVSAISTSSIVQGNSKIEVVDTGTGTVTVTVDGSTALTVDATGVVVAGNFTVSGTTTTVNSNTIALADNILTLNSDATGTPTQNAGLEVNRGSSTNVQLRWNEGSQTWTFTNDGSVYYPMAVSTTDLAEGTNQYFTTTRARTSISATSASGVSYNNTSGVISLGSIPNSSLANNSVTINSMALSLGGSIDLTTDYISEGASRQYFTTARARSAVSVSGSLSYNSSTGVISYTTPTTSGITEGTNLYYTDARARSAVSAGTGISYSSSTGVITNTITQYTDALARGAVSVSGDLSYSSSTGVISFTQNKAWSALTGTPTTISGYGITNAYTKTEVDSAITTAVAGKDNTDEITEGTTNLYFTNARARSAVSAGTGISYNSTTGVITNTITQYTDALARGAVSAGTGISYNSTTGAISTSAIPNASLANSSVTVTAGTGMSGGGSVALGGTVTLTNAGVTSNVAGAGISLSGSTGAVTITNTGVTSAAAGTGVSVSGATGAVTFSIGQAVGTSSNVTFNDLTLAGNLTVNGTTTTINATTLDVADLNITVAKNAASAAAANGAGLTVNGPATPATLTYSSADDRWNMNKTLTATLVGNVTGNVTGAVTGNASTATTLQNARLINGVSFNGSADVTVHTAGTGISISGTTVTNSGVTSIVAGTGISISGGTGAVTVTNTITNNNQLTNGSGYYSSGSAPSFGATSTGALTVTGAITATGEVTAYFSDLRLKTNIVPIADALDKVEAINGVTFDPNEDALALGIDNRHQMGVIAQEIEAVAPELVCDSAFAGYKTVRYDKLTALLIEAVKELSAKVKTLEAQLGGTKPQL